MLEKPEVGERAMEGLLRFIYEGRIPLQSHVHEQEVLFLAQELSVDSAVSLLGHHMGSSVTPQTCMSHLVCFSLLFLFSCLLCLCDDGFSSFILLADFRAGERL